MTAEHRPRWSRRRVCFVAPLAYGLLDPTAKTPFGGAEVRALRLARGLAGREGFEVSVIVRNGGQPRRQRIGDLDVVTYRSADETHELSTGWAWTKVSSKTFLKNTPWLLRKYFTGPERVATYYEINADVYIGFGINDATAELIAFGRRISKPVIVLASSDEDLSDAYLPGSTEVNSYFSQYDRCHFALRNVDSLIVQTERQHELAFRHYGLKTRIIRNPVEMPSETPPAVPGSEKRVVWIGRADRVKQPEIFVDLARMFPDVSFDMVMNPNLAEIAEAVLADTPDNLRIRESIPFDEIHAWVHDAVCLVNTSRFEGFPNTFLDAWGAGIPVLSLNVDPDGVIERFGNGITCGGDRSGLTAGLRRFLDDEAFRRDCGANARTYVADNHDLGSAVDELAVLLTRMTGRLSAMLLRRHLVQRRRFMSFRPLLKGLYRPTSFADQTAPAPEIGSTLSVCFVAPYSYSVFNPATQHRFGGVEVQAHLLATELARRQGIKVMFVVWDHGQPAVEIISNVALMGTPGKEMWNVVVGEKVTKGYTNMVKNLSALVNWLTGRPARTQPEPEQNVGTQTHDGNTQPSTPNDEAEAAGSGNDDRSALETGESEPPQVSNIGKRTWKSIKVVIGDILGARWYVLNLGWRILNRGWYVINFGWRAILWTIDCVWAYRRWRELGEPPLDCAKRIFNLDRFWQYRNINADVYIGFGASNFMAELVSTCKDAEKPVIILTASDSDLSEDYRKRSRKRNLYGDTADNCWFTIHNADRLVVQTSHQRKLAMKFFGCPSRVIPNPIDLSIQPNPHRKKETRRYVAWIGKADEVKRPEAFIDLALRFPESSFKLVMNHSQKAVEDRVLSALPGNVEYHEHVARPDIPGFFEDAIAIVNTSLFEGFPNAFIEACRAGTPILALNVDPGEILTKEECGLYAAGDFETLASQLRTLLNDDDNWRHHHDRALAYVERHHNQAKCVDDLIEEIWALSGAVGTVPSKQKLVGHVTLPWNRREPVRW